MADRHYDEHGEPVWLTDLAKDLSGMTDIETRSEEGATAVTQAALIKERRSHRQISKREAVILRSLISNKLSWCAALMWGFVLVTICLGTFTAGLLLFTIALSIVPGTWVFMLVRLWREEAATLSTEVEYRPVR